MAFRSPLTILPEPTQAKLDERERTYRDFAREARRHAWRVREGLEDSTDALDAIATMATGVLGEGPPR